jgi:hypothetical protein
VKDLANRSVVLYLRTKIKKKWAYREVSEEVSRLSSGEYYVSWYDGSKKQMDSVGADPEIAIAQVQKKRLELAYIASGGETKQPDKKKELEAVYLAAGGEIKTSNSPPTDNGPSKKVSLAVKEYLEDCDDREGKSGYGWPLGHLRPMSTASAF